MRNHLRSVNFFTGTLVVITHLVARPAPLTRPPAGTQTELFPPPLPRTPTIRAGKRLRFRTRKDPFAAIYPCMSPLVLICSSAWCDLARGSSFRQILQGCSGPLHEGGLLKD